MLGRRGPERAGQPPGSGQQGPEFSLPQDSGSLGRVHLWLFPGGRVSAFIQFSKGSATLEGSSGHCIHGK